MSSKVLICYRHDDAGAWTKDLLSGLALDFSDEQLITCSDEAEPPFDVEGHLLNQASDFAACLLIIDTGWIDAGTSEGRRYLDEPADIVRRVIEAALKKRVWIIPILVDRARMPTSAQLPASIAALSSRQAMSLSLRLSRSDITSVVLAIGEGRAGDLTPLRTNLLKVGAYALLAAPMGDGIYNWLANKIVSPSSLDFNRWSGWNAITAISLGLISFLPFVAIRYWMVRQRGRRITEPERTLYQLGVVLLTASSILDAVKIANQDYSDQIPNYSSYFVALVAVCALVFFITFRQFAIRAGNLSQIEWAIGCGAIFFWTYISAAPLDTLFNAASRSIPSNYAELIRFGAAVAMTLLIAAAARFSAALAIRIPWLR